MVDEVNPPERLHIDRPGDKGFWCAIARRFSDVWDFIDDRDIDKHATAAAIILFFMMETVNLTRWGQQAYHAWLDAAKAGHAIAGVEVAAVLAAVLGPWSLLTGAVLSFTVSFYFKART